MQVDDKSVKEMFLERLPTDVQTILASGSQDLTVSQLAEMADRMVEVQRFQSPSVAQISSPSSSVNEHLMKQLSAMADEMASLKIQLARLTSSRSCSRRRSPETGKPVSQRIDATVFSGSSGSGRTFYVCDTATRRRFLVDTGAQISVVPPTAAAKAEFEHMLQLGIIRPSEALGHPHCTWCPRRHQATGDPVATIELSTALPFLIDTPCLIFRTLLEPFFG
ncbi:hypothetical protein SprV_0501771800 [Sparganum proliferum]